MRKVGSTKGAAPKRISIDGAVVACLLASQGRLTTALRSLSSCSSLTSFNIRTSSSMPPAGQARPSAFPPKSKKNHQACRQVITLFAAARFSSLHSCPDHQFCEAKAARCLGADPCIGKADDIRASRRDAAPKKDIKVAFHPFGVLALLKLFWQWP